MGGDMESSTPSVGTGNPALLPGECPALLPGRLECPALLPGRLPGVYFAYQLRLLLSVVDMLCAVPVLRVE